MCAIVSTTLSAEMSLKIKETLNVMAFNRIGKTFRNIKVALPTATATTECKCTVC